MTNIPILLFTFASFWAYSIARYYDQEYAKPYTNEWVVRMEGGEEVAELISTELGYTFLGKVSYTCNTQHLPFSIYLFIIN